MFGFQTFGLFQVENIQKQPKVVSNWFCICQIWRQTGFKLNKTGFVSKNLAQKYKKYDVFEDKWDKNHPKIERNQFQSSLEPVWKRFLIQKYDTKPVWNRFGLVFELMGPNQTNINVRLSDDNFHLKSELFQTEQLSIVWNPNTFGFQHFTVASYVSSSQGSKKVRNISKKRKK